MSSRLQQQGFAIALLLWMIAGMSLMVAAVIHFARADIGMAELRAEEAQHLALGRGVALIAMRGAAMPTQPVTEFENEADADAPDSSLFTLNFSVNDDLTARAVVRPASGYIAMNDAGADELQAFFVQIGQMSEERAYQLVEEALVARQEHPGFRYAEELLELPSLRLGEYALLRGYIQPYRTGPLQTGVALPELKQAFDYPADGMSDKVSRPQAGGTGTSSGPEQMTFEAMAEYRRRSSGRSETTINAVEISISTAEGARTEQVVWVSPHVSSRVRRAEPVRRASRDE